MINRWQGNTGRVQRVQEKPGRPEPFPPAARQRQQSTGQSRTESGGLAGLPQLGRILNSLGTDMETEDIILLLILYLMYRESGDAELLMIMGAMFLL